MQDGTPWPGNIVRDHPGMIQVRCFLNSVMEYSSPGLYALSQSKYDDFNLNGLIQVFLGQNGVRDVEGNELPRLIYVSREKRPGFDHHKKAGAMNALVGLSLFLPSTCVLSNFLVSCYLSNCL